MKKKKINLRKLSLNKDVISHLNASQAGQVMGGSADTQVLDPSRCVLCYPDTQNVDPSRCVLCYPDTQQVDPSRCVLCYPDTTPGQRPC